MDAAKEVEQESEGVQSNSGGSTEEQHEDKPNQPKSRSVPEFLGLSRCAACYNHKRSSMFWRGGNGESSSSAEDSGPEVDCESEAESSSSSSCPEPPSSETPESASFICGDAAEPEQAGEDGDGREEAGEMSEDKSEKKGVTERAPLVKSSVVSTLHLQVLSKKYDDDDDDDNAAFCIVKHHLSEREGSENRGGGPINNLLPPQTGLPWQQQTSQQHHLSYRYQQHQPPRFPPLSAQGQRLPPPLHTLPVFHPPPLYTPPPQAPNAPQTHLHALTAQPCWCCYGGLPPSPYWSHYGNREFPQ